MLVEYDSSWYDGYKPVFEVKRSSGNANVPEFCRIARGDGKMYQPSSIVDYYNAHPNRASSLACFLMCNPSVPPMYNKGRLQNAHLVASGNWTYIYPTHIDGATLEFADNAYAPYVSWSSFTGTSNVRDNAFLHIKYHSSGPTVKACCCMRVSWIVATNCIEKMGSSMMYFRNYKGEYKDESQGETGSTKNAWWCGQRDLNKSYIGYPLYVLTACRYSESGSDTLLWRRNAVSPDYLSSSRPDADIFFGFGAAGGFSSSNYLAILGVMYEWGRFYYNGQS